MVLSADRRQLAIADMLRSRDFISVEELAAHFAVATQTIRRDLVALCDQGVARRRHGGIERLTRSGNLSFGDRRVLHREAKQSIAASVASHVRDGESIALGIGANTTVFSLVNAGLLRPLPIENPSRVVALTNVENTGKGDEAFKRLVEGISEYNIVVEHVPGVTNVLPDYLSRPRITAARQVAAVQVASPRQTSAQDDLEEKYDTIRAVHVEVGHAGPRATATRAQKIYPGATRSGLETLAARVCRDCIVCACADARIMIKYKLGINELYPKRKDCLHMDLATTKLPDAKFILVAMDHFSSKVWVRALPSKRADDVLDAIRSVWEHGPFRRIFCDRGTEFDASVADFCEQEGVLRLHPPPRSPWSNGRIERMVGEVKRGFSRAQINAVLHAGGIPPGQSAADFAAKTERDINAAPRESLLGLTADQVFRKQAPEHLQGSLPGRDWATIDAAIVKRRRKAQEKAAEKGATIPNWHVGDLVLLAKEYWAQRETFNPAGYEAAPRWFGPFKITEIAEQGHVLMVTRDFQWKRNQRGRRVDDEILVHIRYAKRAPTGSMEQLRIIGAWAWNCLYSNARTTMSKAPMPPTSKKSDRKTVDSGATKLSASDRSSKTVSQAWEGVSHPPSPTPENPYRKPRMSFRTESGARPDPGGNMATRPHRNRNDKESKGTQITTPTGTT